MNYKTIVTSFALVAATSVVSIAQSDPFADQVTAYNSGTGFATDFATGLGYTNVIAALGAPSAITPGEFGGPVTPFSPPFLGEQLLSIGEGGMAVFEFDPPVFNHPANPFGLDLIIYGNAGFSITNGNFTGGGITDGSIFGQNSGSTRISVSADNESFYQLNPDLAPVVDGYFPTDGSGRSGIPVDPSTSGSDFAGADIAAIQARYKLGAGGTGYDLDWAQTSDGTSVQLNEVRFVKIEVIEGKSEIDSLSAVQPTENHPSEVIFETFQENPFENGWSATGDTSLFEWDASEQRLAATWDSSKPNSYFTHTLDQTVSTGEDFSIAFDLHLDAIEIGTTTDKPFTFPIAIGLIDFAQATRDDYFRGTGISAVHGPKGVAEWNYLPDSGFGATVSSGLISQDNQWAFQNTFPLELSPGTLYQIELTYQAATGVLATTMTADGEPFGPILDAKLSDIFGNPVEGGFTRLDVDAFAISSYSDEGQSPPEFAGSIRANGFVDNIRVTIDSAPTIDQIQISDSQISLTFAALAGKTYWLEHSTDLINWMTIQQQVAEANETAEWNIDRSGPIGFFRLRAGN